MTIEVWDQGYQNAVQGVCERCRGVRGRYKTRYCQGCAVEVLREKSRANHRTEVARLAAERSTGVAK